MAAALTIPAPDSGSVPDGTAAALAHFPGFNAITNTGGCTIETDAQTGRRYVQIPASASFVLNPYSTSQVNLIDYFAMSFDMEYSKVEGQTWTDNTKRIVQTVDSGTQFYFGHRTFTVDGIDKIFLTVFQGGDYDRSFIPQQPGILLDTLFTHGQGMMRAANGGHAMYHNGILVGTCEGDTTATNVSTVGSCSLQTQAWNTARVYFPIKVWNTDFRNEDEFVRVPDNQYSSSWMQAYSGIFGPWRTSGDATFTVTKYATSGVNPLRSRAVISGSPGDQITFELQPEYGIGANKSNGQIVLRPHHCLLPNGASMLWTLSGDSMENPIRVLLDGTEGTASARPLKIDPGTGEYAYTGIEYNQANRQDLALILASTGRVILHDLTESDPTDPRIPSALSGFDGLIDSIDTCTITITVGSSGSPEFEGIRNPEKLQFNICSSYVATNVSSLVPIMPVANNYGQYFGQYFPDFLNDEPATFDSSNPLGRSGRAFSTFAQNIGGFGATGLLPHMSGMDLCVLENMANDGWSTSIQSTVEAFIDGCAEYGVGLVWVTQLPLPSDTDDQASIRANNAHALAYLEANAAGQNFRVSDIAAEYTDEEAEALSSDDVHLTGANFELVGNQLEGLIETLIGSVGGPVTRPLSQMFPSERLL